MTAVVLVVMHIILVLIVLSLAVLVHERGHVWMAHKRGLRPLKTWRTGWLRYSPFVTGIVSWPGGTDEDERKILLAGLAIGLLPLIGYTAFIGYVPNILVVWVWVAYFYVARSDFARVLELSEAVE